MLSLSNMLQRLRHYRVPFPWMRSNLGFVRCTYCYSNNNLAIELWTMWRGKWSRLRLETREKWKTSAIMKTHCMAFDVFFLKSEGNYRFVIKNTVIKLPILLLIDVWVVQLRFQTYYRSQIRSLSTWKYYSNLLIYIFNNKNHNFFIK